MINLSGWIVMIASVGGVTTFLIWCIYKVFRDPEATEDLHPPLDAGIDPSQDDEE